jgi:hypothetical protein
MVNKTTRKRGKRGGAGEAGAGEAEVAAAKAEAEAAKAKAVKEAEAAEAAEAAKAAKAAKAAEAAKTPAAVKEAAKVGEGEAAKVVATAEAAKVGEGEEAKVREEAGAKVGEPIVAAEEGAKVGEPIVAPEEGEAAGAKVGEPIVAPEKGEAAGAKTPGEPNAKAEREATQEEILAAQKKNTPEELQNKTPEELQKEAEELQKEAEKSGSQEELLDALKKTQKEPGKSGESGEPGESGTLESPAIPGASIVITQEQPVEDKRRVYKGGEALKDTIYMLFSSILLLTSYLLFCFATVLFINACININFLNKEVNDKDKISPIAMQPVFDYLKPNNFMFLDKFILEPQSPIFITVIVIIGVSLACLVLLIGFWSSNANKDDTRFACWKDSNIPDIKTLFSILKNRKDTNDINEKKKTKKFIALLKYLPYLYIFIIFSTYNEITNDNRINLENLKKDTFDTNFQDFNTNGTFTKEDNSSGIKFLKELKNIIIRYIYNDITYSNENIIRELENKLGKTTLNVTTVINSNIITKTIFDIYGKYYNYKVDANKNIGDENNLIKHHKLTYINHINNYFNMLINDTEQSKVKAKANSSPNYYTRFYLIGLIKEEPLNTDYKPDTSLLTNLKDELKTKLTGVKNRIRGYYIAVITFYVLFICLICGFYYKEFWLYILDILVRYKLTNWRAALIIAIVFIILLVYGILFATTNYKV